MLLNRHSGRLVFVSILLLAAMPAAAHKLRVFAAADGRLIQGSVYFAGGGPAAGARLRIEDAQGGLLAEPVPDGQGAFSYRAASPVDHLVIADTGDGHRAQWRVSAAELVAGFPDSAVATGAAAPAPPIQAIAPEPAVSDLDPAQLAAIERAIARQLRPLREALNAQTDRVELRDVLGGLGYIAGIAGLLLWWHSRRSRDGR